MLILLMPLRWCYLIYLQILAQRDGKVGRASACDLGLLKEKEGDAMRKWLDSQTYLFLLAPLLMVWFNSIPGHILAPPCGQLPVVRCGQNLNGWNLMLFLFFKKSRVTQPLPVSPAFTSYEHMLPVSAHFLCVYTSCEFMFPMSECTLLCACTSCKYILPVYT